MRCASTARGEPLHLRVNVRVGARDNLVGRRRTRAHRREHFTLAHETVLDVLLYLRKGARDRWAVSAEERDEARQGSIAFERREVVAHAALVGVYEHGAHSDDVVACEQRARVLVIKRQVAARVTGRVHRAERNGKVAFKLDDVAVFDEAVNSNTSLQLFGGQTMRRDLHIATELFAKTLDATDVVGVMVREDYLTQSAAFVRKLSDELLERVLLVFVRRAGVYDDEVARAHDVAVGRRRGRLRRRAYGEADEAGKELNPSHGLATRLRHGQESLR